MRRRIASTTGRSRIAQRYYHWPLGRQLPPTSAVAFRRMLTWLGSSGSTIARCHPTGVVPDRGRTNAATAQARGAKNDHETQARSLGPSGPSMIIRSYLVTLWAVLFVSCGPTVAQSVAVFDFELELVGLEDALHRPQADPYRRGQHPSLPMSGFSRRRPGHEVDNLLDGRGRQRWLARFARLVAQQPINALLHKPRLPAPYHRLGFARPAHDLGGPAAISGGKDDLGARHMLLQGAAIRDDRLKPTAIHWGDVDDSSCSHDQSLNCFTRFGNRPNESDH